MALLWNGGHRRVRPCPELGRCGGVLQQQLTTRSSWQEATRLTAILQCATGALRQTCFLRYKTDANASVVASNKSAAMIWMLLLLNGGTTPKNIQSDRMSIA